MSAHLHTEGPQVVFYMLLLYLILSPPLSPDVSGMLLSVLLSLCVCVFCACVRD